MTIVRELTEANKRLEEELAHTVEMLHGTQKDNIDLKDHIQEYVN
jgi:ABC-type uncharacterized transport system ATPase component